MVTHTKILPKLPIKLIKVFTAIKRPPSRQDKVHRSESTLMSENMMSEASKTHPMICTTISTLQMLSEEGEDTVSDILTDHAIISGIMMN